MPSQFEVERLRLDSLDLNVPDVAQLTNLHINPSAEVDTTKVTAYVGGTLSRDTAQSKFGAASFAMTSAGAGMIFQVDDQLASGTLVSCAVWVRIAASQAVVLSGRAISADGTTVLQEGISAADYVGTGDWQLLKVEGWTRTGATFRPHFQITGTSGAAFHADQATLVLGSSLPATFDGDTPGYEWVGTSHASKSRPAPRISCLDFDWKPAKKLLEWVRSPDSDGSRLVRPPKHEQAQLNLTLQVGPESTMDAAIDVVQEIVAKLQEAERVAAFGPERGLALEVAPANSTYQGTVYVQAGEVEEVPRDHQSGYFARAPQLKVRLDCEPFIVMEEQTYPGSPSSDTAPIATLVVEDVGGDVWAEGELVGEDAATKDRGTFRWSLENRHYNAATSLICDSDDMIVTGYAGAQVTESGFYDPNASGNNGISATLTTSPVAVCSTPELAHIGTFRVLAALKGSASGVRARLSWRAGRAPFKANPYVETPHPAKRCEVDLGTITIPVAQLGTQTWTGRIEAYSEASGDTLKVDCLLLEPIGDVGGGKARNPPTIGTPTVFSDWDRFAQSAGALAAKTSAGGQTWAGAGDADDFQVETSGATAQRTATADADANTGRYAVSGVSAFAAQHVQVDHKRGVILGPSSEILTSGVLARYADTSNYLLAGVEVTNTATAEISDFVVKKRVAGTVTELARIPIGPGGSAGRSTTGGQTWWTSSFYSTALRVDASGRWFAWWWLTGGPTDLITTGQDSALATGGALASGKPGFYDAFQGTGATLTRNYDNFQAWAPESQAVVFSGQTIEFHSNGLDAALREDSTGTYAGTPPEYRGARFALPPGDSRIGVIARRNDIVTMPSEDLADGVKLQVRWRERHLVFPGS